MTATLQKTIDYNFKDEAILQQALTHASKSPQHLERQEFLGDAVLGLVVADYLYNKHPDSPEGDLSKMRANLVCKPALLKVAKAWSLAQFLIVGDGERNSKGGLKSESIAANAVESVIGAVFLDAGWQAAQAVVLRAWAEELRHVKPVNLRDAKSELQELTQAHALGVPEYELLDLGTNAEPRFEARCFIHKARVGVGHGARKKVAEIDAAKHALEGQSLKLIIQEKQKT